MTDGRRLLVVDDEAGTRDLLTTFFTKKGFVVTTAADGLEALGLVEGADAVLLDMMMPGLDGLEVLRRWRAQGAAVPVVLLTAVTSTDAVVAAMQAGAQDYVTKPFSLPVLLARVQRLLEAPPVADEDDVVEEGDLDVVEEHDDLVIMAPAVPDDADHDADDIEAPTVAAASPVTSSLLSRLKQMTRLITSDQRTGLTPGQVLAGRYRLSEPLGSGSFGAVWRARHIELDVDVAVKVLHRSSPPIRPGETALESFRKEAMLAARLSSPHAVRVNDFGVTDDGDAFLVMELLLGESLRQRLTRHGPLAVDFVCAAVADVCDALAAAHRHGVVHRDVKALNVFVADVDDDGPHTTIKLIDFGAAADLDDEATGAVLVGTPSHMAPERFLDPRGTPASDVYAVGVMLYQLLTGAMPWVADNVQGLARHHERTPVPRPSARREGIVDCDDVVGAAMAKEPSARPSARAMSTWLRRLALAHGGD